MTKDIFLTAELNDLCLKLFCLASFVCPTSIQNAYGFPSVPEQKGFNCRTLSLMLFFIRLPKVCRNKEAEEAKSECSKEKKISKKNNVYSSRKQNMSMCKLHLRPCTNLSI